jgi:hypothetical protein
MAKKRKSKKVKKVKRNTSVRKLSLPRSRSVGVSGGRTLAHGGSHKRVRDRIESVTTTTTTTTTTA